MLRGTFAAALTPLTGRGAAVDEEAFGPYVDFLASHEVDGILVCGTTGEGVLFDVDERKRIAELYLEAAAGALTQLQVAVHCGAQSTADTIALAEHAATNEADAVAVIAPPYFALDADELFAHFAAAAHACDPLPFYVYEFIGRSGYPVPVPVIERLRDEVPNLAGLKVSDTPFDAVKPYLIDDLDVFIGFEPLVLDGLAAGAVGVVSGLASAWPEVVAELVHERSEGACARVIELRDRLDGIGLPAAAKQLLTDRGILQHPDVRAPLRQLSDEERVRVATL
jgi:dihydrodipicolinate synthase/N-acetylneuraminate lyase